MNSSRRTNCISKCSSSLGSHPYYNLDAVRRNPYPITLYSLHSLICSVALDPSIPTLTVQSINSSLGISLPPIAPRTPSATTSPKPTRTVSSNLSLPKQVHRVEVCLEQGRSSSSDISDYDFTPFYIWVPKQSSRRKKQKVSELKSFYSCFIYYSSPAHSPPTNSPFTNSPPTKSPPTHSPPTHSPPNNSPPTHHLLHQVKRTSGGVTYLNEMVELPKRNSPEVKKKKRNTSTPSSAKWYKDLANE